FIGDKPGGHSRRHRNFVRTPTLSLIIALLVPVKFYKNGISSKSGCSRISVDISKLYKVKLYKVQSSAR
ncbi:MAG: hypothetical protein ACFB02_17605, partial [Mastigocoleus sp.]